MRVVIDVVAVVSSTIVVVAVDVDAIRGSIVPCSRRDIIVIVNDDDVATDDDLAEATRMHYLIIYYPREYKASVVRS